MEFKRIRRPKKPPPIPKTVEPPAPIPQQFPPYMADSELPRETTNGMAAMLIYVLIRYYITRSLFVKHEKIFMPEVCSKFSDLIKRAGEKNVCDMIKGAMDQMCLRLAETSRPSGAFEELGFSKALKDLGYVKVRKHDSIHHGKSSKKTGGVRVPDSAAKGKDVPNSVAAIARRKLKW